jgi:hypothetical protein
VHGTTVDQFVGDGFAVRFVIQALARRTPAPQSFFMLRRTSAQLRSSRWTATLQPPRRLAPAVFIGLLGACSGISEPLEIFTAESALQPADGAVDPVTGTVAMVIRERQTQIGIGVRGGSDGTQFGWSVRNGSCSGSGDRVGPASAFPAIVIGEDGDGDAETVIFRRLPVDGVYAAEVFDGAAATGTVRACADLVPGG